ncbi:MAG: hypothetical protein U0869_01120 [Chloroflexota bacterium]
MGETRRIAGSNSSAVGQKASSARSKAPAARRSSNAWVEPW